MSNIGMVIYDFESRFSPRPDFLRIEAEGFDWVVARKVGCLMSPLFCEFNNSRTKESYLKESLKESKRLL